MGFKKAMVKRNQELIDQFNREEERHWQLQWLKVKQRVRFPKLRELPHAILDLLCKAGRPGLIISR